MIRLETTHPSRTGELLAFWNAAFAGRRNFKMYFSPVESVTQGCDGVHAKLLRKLDYGQLEADLYRYAWEPGLADVPYAPRFLGICSALRPNDFILVPNGDIHKCWDTVTFPAKRVGNIFDNIDILASPNPNKAVWDTFNPFEIGRASCRERV